MKLAKLETHQRSRPRALLRPAEFYRLQDSAYSATLYVIAVTVALGVSAVIIAATGGSPSSVFTAMFDGSLGLPGSLGLTIDEATPIMIVAFGSIIAFRAGLINIGQEGQLLIGATVGAFIALKLSGPDWLIMLLAVLGATLGGALWAGIPALLRFWGGVDEVISSLLLVFVAIQIATFTVTRDYLLQEHVPPGFDRQLVSDPVPANARLPNVSLVGDQFNIGAVVALVAGVVVIVVLLRSPWGFRVRMLGLNPVAAHRSGVSMARLGGMTLVLSGAFAGLAGGILLLGRAFQLDPTLSNNYGWDGLLVALVARNQPIAVIPIAFFFGMLRSGGGLLASTGVARFMVDVVRALLVLALILPPIYTEARRRRWRAAAQAERT